MATEMSRFPSCFPQDFVEKILPQGLPPLELDVFRVCLNGKICKESFLSTFEEVQLGLKKPLRNWEKCLNNASTYSVSCSVTIEPLRNMLKCALPLAILVCGKASSTLGPLARTKDWNLNSTNENHVDWWLYRESDPSELFSQVEVSFES